MPDSNTTQLTPSLSAGPDYVGLVKFLVKPFLESPDSLKIDCEISSRKSRILIRLAFDGEDKGRVFGRGGRNIQAIRTVLQAVAQMSGCSVHLEIYGGPPSDQDSGSHHSSPPSKPPPRRSRPHLH